MAGDAIANDPAAYTRSALTHLLLSYGLFLLFVLVALESTGVPLPGETALITASILASQGHYSIEAVIAVAATGAIVGDNAGYWLGRKGGRALLRRLPFLSGYFDRVLPPAERFFQRHGAKAVFFGRFVSVLRVTAAWLAGISHMSWWRFLFWNAAGGIVWAVAYGTVAYVSGRAAADAITHYGLYAAGGIVVLAGILFLGFHLWRRRVFGRR
jgi:membrane protein DedA with SNARE-associated domain